LSIVQARAGAEPPELAFVLGSGLGGFADKVEGAVSVAYSELPGFPKPGVGGHAGRLVIGRLAGRRVALLQGRAHYYEEGRADAMKIPVRLIKAMGAKSLILTNAAGSLHADRPPGALMLISDHINLTGQSPLFGDKGDSRFVDMVGAYDAGLREAFQRAAKHERIDLSEGTYIWFAGPQFETPAEIRMAKILGADAVGMSTVPEAILARQAGLKLAALSIITNLAAGMDKGKLSHEQTQKAAAMAAQDLSRLLIAFLAEGAG